MRTIPSGADRKLAQHHDGSQEQARRDARDFRGNYLYNLMDENVLRFNAEVPQIWQWDDHEVMNNWSPGKRTTLP
jgi:phosphodiesterase/alkaline phosphatase D-like protein